ncbi:AraC family transcriptional regulator [Sphingobacterium sp. N143]|uniref:helix-turn-helix domain-containing protein n=1 Tax=Sphingobacterium sp. N143 TaxID=2746727 RepID=UPI00257831AD|nr:helix-turn-helix domain-containing protein [Sphingobacterium sp. N143]MDM1296821.1 AraC family transcriptional regulator [Sphingobacterium sp. N143]
MIKTFHFKLPQVTAFSNQIHAFLPKLPGAHLQRYEDVGIQLLEEYIDYHPVIFYRIQVHVQAATTLAIKTAKADHHLLYNLHSPDPIVLQKWNLTDQIVLPSGYDSYVYVPKGKFRSDVVQGEYLVYGALIDIGLVRPELYKEGHFLQEFKLAGLRNKKQLYQSAIWPILKKTKYQLEYIIANLFKYHRDNEAIAAKVVYDLFDLAIYKDFEIYQKMNASQITAERAHKMIKDQVVQTFSSLSIQTIADQLRVDIGYLGKMYKSVYGESPRQTLNQLLIEKAKNLLTAGYTVKEVAHYCGYNQESNFSNFFHKQTGIRPSVFGQDQDEA